MCGSLCLQHKVNEFLDGYQKDEYDLLTLPVDRPNNLNFI
jgi:hypothetical protein